MRPEILKRINEDSKLQSLLYDLDLLPEQVFARVRVAVEEERERCARIAENETELPGPMPENVRKRLAQMGDEEAHRLTVRLTKMNIAKRIRSHEIRS